MDFVEFQLPANTADYERDLGIGLAQSKTPQGDCFPPGVYRVIDGELFRIVNAIPFETNREM